MDFQIYLLTCFLLNVVRISNAAAVEIASDPDAEWENFKKTYQKIYEVEEEMTRRKNFESNFKKITEHNRRYDQGLHSFQLGINEFADMIFDDFVKMVNGLITGETNPPIPYIVPDNDSLPDSIDWRKEGAVTPVKNQGQCGACFAFSATGALEGQNKLKHGKLVSLSEQNIIDCSRREGNLGCQGGMMDSAFEYVMVNKGLDSEKSYPYKDREGLCLYKSANSATKCVGYSDIIPRNEATLKKAVALVGPISVGIDASHDSFQLYKGGIYDEPRCSSVNLDHGVLAVGYGSENGKDYWIVKNSWGPRWGEDGYIRMSRNKNNQCGIATQASFPVV